MPCTKMHARKKRATVVALAQRLSKNPGESAKEPKSFCALRVSFVNPSVTACAVSPPDPSVAAYAAPPPFSLREKGGFWQGNFQR